MSPCKERRLGMSIHYRDFRAEGASRVNVSSSPLKLYENLAISLLSRSEPKFTELPTLRSNVRCGMPRMSLTYPRPLARSSDAHRTTRLPQNRVRCARTRFWAGFVLDALIQGGPDTAPCFFGDDSLRRGRSPRRKRLCFRN